MKTAAAFAAVSVIWALTWIFIKIGVASFPPLLFAGIRTMLSAAVFYAYARAIGIPLGLRRVSFRTNALIGVLFFGIPTSFTAIGEQTVNASVAAVVFGGSPILTITMARIFLGERLTVWRAAAVLLGISGILYLYVPALMAEGMHASMGLLFILAAAVSGSAGVIIAKKKLHDEVPAACLPVQMLTVGPIILLASGISESYASARLTQSVIVAILFLAIFASGLSYALYFWLLKRMPISQIVYMDFTYPILSIFFGWLLLDEQVSERLFVATAAIIAGGMLASRGSLTPVTTEEPPVSC